MFCPLLVYGVQFGSMPYPRPQSDYNAECLLHKGTTHHHYYVSIFRQLLTGIALRASSAAMTATSAASRTSSRSFLLLSCIAVRRNTSASAASRACLSLSRRRWNSSSSLLGRSDEYCVRYGTKIYLFDISDPGNWIHALPQARIVTLNTRYTNSYSAVKRVPVLINSVRSFSPPRPAPAKYSPV